MTRFKLSSGWSSALPTSREDARGLRKDRYDNDNLPPCEVCAGYYPEGSRAPHVRYTMNNTCGSCAQVDAGNVYNLLCGRTQLNDNGLLENHYMHHSDGSPLPISGRLAEFLPECISQLYTLPQQVGIPHTIPQPPFNSSDALEKGVPCYIGAKPCVKCGAPGLKTLTGACFFCEKRKATLSPRQEAIKNGKTWYTPTTPCKKCGETAKKRASNGECSGCTDVTPREVGYLSPRQEAIKNGKTWYTPTTPCKKCNTMSERNVFNGTCRGCTGQNVASDNRETAESVMMREAPDLVISRADAMAQGLKVFRTGDICKRGHTGFRYVSTGGCIECKNGK